MNAPNIITISRILLVPVTIWFVISGDFRAAFAVFLVAAISDGVDGWLARRTGTVSELGAHLDPLADKALLVSTYGALGVMKMLPSWLVLTVITRDVLIIGGVLLAWFMGKPMAMKPHPISKANTVGQILLMIAALGTAAFEYPAQPFIIALCIAVAALTVGSLALYMKAWVKQMNNGTVQP